MCHVPACWQQLPLRNAILGALHQPTRREPQAICDESAYVYETVRHLLLIVPQAYQEARDAAAAEAAVPKPSAPAADECEVARVLASKSDYDCLQVNTLRVHQCQNTRE